MVDGARDRVATVEPAAHSTARKFEQKRPFPQARRKLADRLDIGWGRWEAREQESYRFDRRHLVQGQAPGFSGDRGLASRDQPRAIRTPTDKWLEVCRLPHVIDDD